MLVPANAGASFHLNKIREVYPGTVADPNSQYVVLQMPSTGENFLGGHQMVYYNGSGTQIGTSSPTNVASKSQGTILFATTSSILSVPRDFAINFNMSQRLNPAAGAVCWAGVDCVSWGAFNNTSGTALPSAAGTPAPPIADGDALVRRITRGCSTLFEFSDDTDSSDADFSLGTPHPRNLASTPTERPCPNTTITRAPKSKTTDRTPKFKFKSSQPNSTFKCKLDSKPFKPCTSPDTLPKLKRGKHTFKVKAVHQGVSDPTPARKTFKVVRPHH